MTYTKFRIIAKIEGEHRVMHAGCYNDAVQWALYMRRQYNVHSVIWERVPGGHKRITAI